MTSRTQVRDFLHVEDVASAVWAVARSNLRGPVNVGSGRPATVRKVVASLGVILGRPDRIVFGAIPNDPAGPAYLCADTGRLTKGTGWTPRYDLDSGLRNTVAWWQRHLGRGGTR